MPWPLSVQRQIAPLSLPQAQEQHRRGSFPEMLAARLQGCSDPVFPISMKPPGPRVQGCPGLCTSCCFFISKLAPYPGRFKSGPSLKGFPAATVPQLIYVLLIDCLKLQNEPFCKDRQAGILSVKVWPVLQRLVDKERKIYNGRARNFNCSDWILMNGFSSTA